MKRPVRLLYLHEGVFTPIFGDIGKVIPSKSKTINNLEITFHEEGNYFEVSGSVRGIKDSFMVPAANVKSASFDLVKEKANAGTPA